MRPLLAVLALPAVPVALVLCGCSGTSPGNIFIGVVAEAGAPSVNNGDGGNLVSGPEAGTFGSPPPAQCDPQSTAAFSPDWQTPETWKQNVCSTAQITAFYSACLTPPISATACDAFVQANGTCAPCLQSQDTDPTSSAMVWHEQMKYWTVNVAGCIAQATGDPSGAGCGAAYGAAIACRQSSCNACWEAQGTTATFQQFSDCETQAGSTTCQTYATAVPTKCGNLAKSAASVCMPSSSATAQDAFMQIAPLFCGQ
ncbi:MAG: hypothetical protein ACRELB_03470 [Polyangiaceae bacterium]